MPAPSDTQEAAKRYIEAGFAPIPLPPGSKNPNRPGWQSEHWSLGDVPKGWNNGQGIGLLLGVPSGGLVDVDLDRTEARAVAPYLLPRTRASGRESCQSSHRWYICDPIPETNDYKLPGKGDDRCVVELRSTGRQTVVAPSVHPDGDKYGGGEGTLATIAGDELAERVKDVAIAALLVINWPGTGARHDYVNAVTGYLGRNLAPERTQRIMEAAIHTSGDEEASARLTDVRDTLHKLERGEHVTGGPTLDRLAPGVPEQLERWGCVQRSRPATTANADGTEDLKQYELSDLGNADRFIARHGKDVRWCSEMKAFLVWDGKRWCRDVCRITRKLAQETARSIHHEAAAAEDRDEQRRVSRWAVASQSASKTEAMLSQAIPHLAVSMDDLDASPWLINCENGTVDLRTGIVRPHNRDDLITKLAPAAFDPEAKAPRFERFLRETLVDDAVISFVQRFAGYSLTGDTRERALAILWGSGKNGKSTLVEIMREAMGDYAKNTDVETVLVKRHTGVSNDVAALKGARFVSAAEVEKGRRLAESKVKNITGQDTVTARFLFGEPFDFRPEFKLWLSTNNKPEIRGTDDAIWDRIRLIPFTQRFGGKRQDRTLSAKLRDELSGVLAWMVAGCLQWQREGLGEPRRVKAATEEYRTEMDTLAAFFEDRCVLHKDAIAPATPLYKEYRSWCDDAGEQPETQKAFGARLRERGFDSISQLSRGPHKGRRGWRGIGLRVDDPSPEDPEEGEKKRKNSASEGDNGCTGRPLVDNGLPDESCLPRANTREPTDRVDDGRPKTHNLSSNIASRRENVEKRSTSSTSSTHEATKASRRRLTEEEARQVQKLISEGMEPGYARAEVIREDA